MKRRSVFKRRLFQPAWKSRLEMRHQIRRGTPWELPDEDSACLSMPTVELEWPKCDESERTTEPRERNDSGTFQPPPGNAVTQMFSKMSEKEFSDFVSLLFEFALEGGDLGYRYWYGVIQELKKIRKVLSAPR